MSRQQFISLILDDERPTRPAKAAAADTAAGGGGGVLFDASLFGETAPTTSADDGIGFARTLLEGSGFGDGRIRETAEVILGDNPAKRSLPQSCWLWPKTSDRPHRTLLFQLENPGSVLLEDGLFRDQRQQKRLEDALHRLIQTAQQGFAVGGGKRTADVEQGKPEETLILVSVDDDRKRQDAPVTLVCFGTVTETTGAFEAFHITNEARQWAQENRALAEDHLSRLYYRHFEKLTSETWQDAFITGKERDLARKLLDVCTAATPDAKRIEETAVKLIRQIATSFGRGHQSPKIEFDLLPKDHFIGADPKAAERPGFENDFAGMTVRDGRERLLGYIVYCLDEKRQADRLRASLAEHNSFHNVLVIYPDGNEATLELWQGKRSLKGKLTKAGARFRGEGEVVNLLSRFFVVSKSEISKPEDLARDLAHRAKYLKLIALGELTREQGSPKTAKRPVLELYDIFNKALVRQTETEFSDAYAQTLTYGLLAARWMARSSDAAFTVANVGNLLPSTSPFLADLFRRLIALHISPRLGWLIEDLVSLLHRTAVKEVFADEDRDPVIHFYEDFLDAYDPSIRATRGVYYTPDDVVQYIVNTAHNLLIAEFGLPLGLADPTTWGQFAQRHSIDTPEGVDATGAFVQILDPATGTGTFLKYAVEVIHDTMMRQWAGPDWTDERSANITRHRAAWTEYVHTSLLPRLYGFELIMAPYIVCHLRLGLLLQDTGFVFGPDDRLRVFLTDAIERPSSKRVQMSFDLDFLAKEGRDADLAKSAAAPSVIIGNPPYSRVSQSRAEFGNELVQPYKARVSGERNQQPLGDDYLKFMALADFMSSRATYSLVGLITNYNWVRGVLFRGVRQMLHESWSRIRVLDLHGAVGEPLPGDANANENVFMISTGVAVCVRFRPPHSNGSAKEVLFSEFWGSRSEKLASLRHLSRTALEEQSWVPLIPRAPFCFFAPSKSGEFETYSAWPDLPALFRDYSSGLMTVRDKLAIARSEDELVERFGRLRSDGPSDDALAEEFGAKPYRNWSLGEARRRVRADKKWKDNIKRITYRPFDDRFLYYSSDVVTYPNWRIMNHLGRGSRNLALVASRLTKNEEAAHFFVSRFPVEIIALSSKSSNNAFVFPLLQFSDGDAVSSNVVGRTEADVHRWLHRNYALLYSKAYRVRYQADLEVGFARLPPRSRDGLDEELETLGAELVALHLMERDYEHAPWNVESDSPSSCALDESPSFPVVGSNLVKAGMPRYDAGSRRLKINGTQYFAPVSSEVWQFKVGGYQLAKNWFTVGRKTRTSRIGTQLTNPEVAHFAQILGVLERTLQIMVQIDQAIDKHGGWPRAFSSDEAETK